MSELTDLYQEIVLDHNTRPRNFRKMERPDRTAEGFNPLCGDRVVLYIQTESDLIKDVTFQGSGCAISRASTSMMTEAVKGKRMADALRLFDMFHHEITGDDDSAVDSDTLGDLEAFAGVRDYPSRVKCASLGWHTLRAALEDKGKVSTE